MPETGSLAWVGLGSNLGEPAVNLAQALRSLRNVASCKVLAVSSLYETPPWGDSEQPDFCNAVAQLETTLAPEALLDAFLAIELTMGRVRDARRWGPRLIDLDLLLYGSLEHESPRLRLPHPEMHRRAFVLVPLCELDPQLTIPGHGTVAARLAELDCACIKKLGPVPESAT